MPLSLTRHEGLCGGGRPLVHQEPSGRTTIDFLVVVISPHDVTMHLQGNVPVIIFSFHNTCYYFCCWVILGVPFLVFHSVYSFVQSDEGCQIVNIISYQSVHVSRYTKKISSLLC